MIPNRPCHLVAFSLCLILALTSAQAETISPIIFSSTGSVSAKEPGKDVAPIIEKAPLPEGTELRTGAPGVALLAIAPGISLKLKDSSSLTLHSTTYSTKQQHASVDLTDGEVICLLRPAESAAKSFTLEVGHGESATALGTAWQSTKAADEKETLVATGTVQWTSMLGGKPILVAPGCLLISSYDGNQKVKSLIIINLRDGTLSEYPLNGGAPTVRSATPEQLATTREKFQALVNEIYQSLGTTERKQLNDLISEINAILLAAGLNPLTSPAATPPPPGPSNNPSDEVTPIRP